MKNFIKIVFGVLISLLFFANSYAAVDIAQNKLAKELAITRNQVTLDYGSTYTKALDKYFTSALYYKEINKLQVLETKLEPLILKYNRKNILSINEKKALNLLNNIYFRSKLVSLYN